MSGIKQFISFIIVAVSLTVCGCDEPDYASYVYVVRNEASQEVRIDSMKILRFWEIVSISQQTSLMK